MGEREPLLRLENLCKDYGQGMILHHLNLDIYPGEFLTLLGPSGCGKTTTLRMIAGLESVTEGRVWLEGRDITGLPPEKRPLNTVFQSYALFPHMNIKDNISFGLVEKRVPKKEIKQRVSEMLKLVRLEGMEHRMPSQLSGGQKQRLCIARALLKKPAVLILDDSTSAVDTATDAKIREAFAKNIPNTTKIIIAQRVSSVMNADRIVVLDDGMINGIGTHEELVASNEIYKDIYESQTKDGGDFDRPQN